MPFQLLIILANLFSISQCSIIDISSIQVIPDLYRLCWKQFGNGKLDYLQSHDGREKFSVFEDLDDSGKIFCIEKRNSSNYVIAIPIINSNIFLNCNFGKLLICPPFIIRNKVVSNGIYFQSIPAIDFQQLSHKFSCICYLIQGPEENKTTRFLCRNHHGHASTNKYISMKPGSSFTLYYYCELNIFGHITSKFVTDQGTIFPREKIDPLQPFLQLPFRRYLVGQWKNPQHVPEIYKIVIYKINNSADENCLKIFHLYRSFTSKNHHAEPMSSCNKSVPVEDLGIFHSNGNDSIHFVLDMVEPLRLNTRYKLSILWMNTINKLEENFIYFEPLSNENSGNINSNILNFNQKNYPDIRNMISDMRQNVINQYPPNITESQSINFNISTELFILQSVQINESSKVVKSTFSEFYFKVRIGLHYFIQKCEKIPHCAEGPHPFFYLMTKTKSNLYRSKYENYMVELITIPKREIEQKTSVNMSSNSKTATFKLSWNMNSDPKTNIPSLFAVLIMKATNDECVSMFIVMCQTCNKMHQQMSEYNSRETLKKWSQNCKILVRLEDHYSAISSSITIKTMEMVPAENFITEIHGIHLNTSRLFGRSKPNYIKESFSSRHGTMIMTFIFGIIGLVLLISLAVLCKRLAKDPRKQSMDVDSNEYYVENGF